MKLLFQGRVFGALRIDYLLNLGIIDLRSLVSNNAPFTI